MGRAVLSSQACCEPTTYVPVLVHVQGCQQGVPHASVGCGWLSWKRVSPESGAGSCSGWPGNLWVKFIHLFIFTNSLGVILSLKKFVFSIGCNHEYTS